MKINVPHPDFKNFQKFSEKNWNPSIAVGSRIILRMIFGPLMDLLSAGLSDICFDTVQISSWDGSLSAKSRNFSHEIEMWKIYFPKKLQTGPKFNFLLILNKLPTDLGVLNLNSTNL